MNEVNKIPSNVTEMINAAADWVGKYEAESFSCEAFAELSETEYKQSPIEMLFQVAIQAVARVNSMPFSEPLDTDAWSTGLVLSPQFQIGKYRADFMVAYYRFQGETSRVVVECDGTAFHERTELERHREKARDRYMQKEGWKVFRYTGREIMDDPYTIAAEVLSILTSGFPVLTPEEYFS
jgi:very-short-patch-repair endonuclease